MSYDAILNERRAKLREHYATFRKLGSIMKSKGLVQWSTKSHRFYAEYPATTYRGGDRARIVQLLKLQDLIEAQSRLVLELEHSITLEEAKNESATV
jgi:hypothetical protein